MAEIAGGDEKKAYHMMQRKGIFPSGAEEWFCPICGYWFVSKGDPSTDKIILDEGERATYLHATWASYDLAKPASNPAPDDLKGSPWEDFINGLNW